MRIEKTDNPIYEYAIATGSSVKIYCDLEQLEDLAFEIERVLKEERAKIQLTVSIAQLKEI